MSSSTMSLIGLYNYYPDLFKFLAVPDEIDKSTLIDNILLRSGEFEVLYADPEFLEFSIGAWSRKWAPTFDRWVKALAVEYNPLENYDRMEDWTDNRDIAGSDKTSHTGNDTTNDSGSESQNKTGTENRTEGGSTSSNTSGTTGSTTTNKVSAYDAGNTLTTKDESTLVGSDSSGTSGTTSLVVSSGDVMNLTGSHTVSIVASHMVSITASHMTADDLVHSGRIHGNIGVTTSQTMLLSELDLGYWNIYEKITDLFLTEFVIPVY